MPNATLPYVEQQVVAFALTHPGFGPRRVSDELRREKWGGIVISANGVWRVLRRHGLNTRDRRLRLVAGYAAPALPRPPQPQPERHLQVAKPGDLIQMDCFCIGHLSGTSRAPSGSTPQSTSTAPTPGPSCALPPAIHWPPHLGAGPPGRSGPGARGCDFKRVMTTGVEADLHPRWPPADQRLCGASAADHPRRVLEAELRSLPGAQVDRPRPGSDQYLRYYNTDRAHHGRWTRGKTPEEVIGKPKVWAS